MNRDRYRWSIAYENKGAPIVSVVSELERVREAAEGRPKPRDVVAAARPAMSPLHRFFLWDDTEAAERYRERQARDLLLNIVVMRAERDAVKEQTYSVEFFQAGAPPRTGTTPGCGSACGAYSWSARPARWTSARSGPGRSCSRGRRGTAGSRTSPR